MWEQKKIAATIEIIILMVKTLLWYKRYIYKILVI